MTVPSAAAARDTRAGVHANLAALALAQKSGAGVPAYTRWVNRRAARLVAAVAAAAGAGPNAVTFASAALTVAGLAGVVLGPPGLATGLIAAVLLAAGYVFDSADGQVARLTGRASRAGEWLDHVVDAIRTPLVHIAVAVACYLHRPEDAWLMALALAYAVLASGQFMSQILAEQLDGGAAREPQPSGNARSLVLLPTDTGVLCWAFALWGAPTVFAAVYAALFAANLLHTAVSMQRKHRRLTR